VPANSVYEAYGTIKEGRFSIPFTAKIYFKKFTPSASFNGTYFG
jgi:hypothetical protein